MNITIIKGITGITIYHWLINHQKIAIMREWAFRWLDSVQLPEKSGRIRLGFMADITD